MSNAPRHMIPALTGATHQEASRSRAEHILLQCSFSPIRAVSIPSETRQDMES
ncbi:predicted protein [Botrytis cinerea T4]|uniref:Uncharacterized protein n=1 Tax=Botryotinia fuckeliana (strain T4) TaxID=999810 RepID=G2Y253_BOTF4|nr:predicted protein [Botrytis cinerea T4]